MIHHNARFPKIWQLLSSVNFTNKTVIDAGCGYGDLAYAIAQTAKKVYAFEQDTDICGITSAKFAHQENLIFVCQENINGWNDEWWPTRGITPKMDILTCFSVLPYLINPEKALGIFREMARVVLIECQYDGDGPGFEHIKNDYDMFGWLELCGYKQIDNLGYTIVEGRNAKRTIWRCG